MATGLSRALHYIHCSLFPSSVQALPYGFSRSHRSVKAKNNRCKSRRHLGLDKTAFCATPSSLTLYVSIPCKVHLHTDLSDYERYVFVDDLFGEVWVEGSYSLLSVLNCAIDCVIQEEFALLDSGCVG